MVTEEPSIVAAVSKMAKLAALKGGFHTEVDPPLLKGQLQFYELPDIDAASAMLREKREELIEYLNGLCPRMLKRGGGVVDLGSRVIASKVGPMLIVEPVVNVCDAMGANIVNTLMEHLALKMQNIFHKKPGLAILSNFCEHRLASARAMLPFNLLATDTAHDQGEEVAAQIIAAHAFAEADPYRACTHNKGILNGIDALAIATGNDFRALEAGAHAFASRNGTYAPLTSMRLDYEQKLLIAELKVPLAVGVVGANCSIHQGVKLAHKILGPFAKTSTVVDLSRVIYGTRHMRDRSRLSGQGSEIVPAGCSSPSHQNLAYALRGACPRGAPGLPSIANGRHQQQLANMKLARASSPASNARDTLVMRRSSVRFR